ncbi:hypothetical protein MJO28_015918 [Puccinia striiformis f. sp. tritici]|uniref:Uncharacterized protein n=1 Tax=Puccinia striiformis f. sp. tritici TaxID=168172 RepID=A0ACC0DRQ9_9BASI|nr:hypothetical protein MJO29_015476 [Puccinia striiformis f. sp. tritici]KAI7937019.1 hypothetical protein MJO28_015918 [Puccinia striiformis f. sp. tritici]
MGDQAEEEEELDAKRYTLSLLTESSAESKLEEEVADRIYLLSQGLLGVRGGGKKKPIAS